MADRTEVVAPPIGATRRLRLVDRCLQRLARGWFPAEPEAAALDGYLFPGAICCDIGAEYGLYTLTFARRVGPGGSVLSFEPLPGPNVFVQRIVRWLGVGNVQVHRLALGDTMRTGTMSLPLRRRLAVHGRAFLADDATGLGANVEFAREQRLPVEVSTLDTVIADSGLDRVDLIKIDVEGYEPAVLRGAQRTIERFRPVLLIEIEDRHLAKFGATAATVVQLVHSHGYRMLRLEAGRWVPADTVTAEIRNYLFTPCERAGVAVWSS